MGARRKHLARGREWGRYNRDWSGHWCSLCRWGKERWWDDHERTSDWYRMLESSKVQQEEECESERDVGRFGVTHEEIGAGEIIVLLIKIDIAITYTSKAWL